VADADFPYAANLSYPFPTATSASIVAATVNVDRELRPDRIRRTVTLAASPLPPALLVSFTATEARYLRVAISSFSTALQLATRTVAAFGDDSVTGGVVAAAERQ
jgi:hypothetical protein